MKPVAVHRRASVVTVVTLCYQFHLWPELKWCSIMIPMVETEFSILRLHTNMVGFSLACWQASEEGPQPTDAALKRGGATSLQPMQLDPSQRLPGKQRFYVSDLSSDES